MRRYGGSGVARKVKPYSYGLINVKAMGSGAANPGSMPITTPGTPMALKTNLSDVNGSTQQVPPKELKYKYKYKYPPAISRKRKISFNDESESDEEMPGIEPRSVPGDQYQEGATMNTQAVKDRAKEKSSNKPDKGEKSSNKPGKRNRKRVKKPKENIVTQNEEEMDEAAYYIGLASGAYEIAKAVSLDTLLPPPLQAGFNIIGQQFSLLAADLGKAKVANKMGRYGLYDVTDKVGVDKAVETIEEKVHVVLDYLKSDEARKDLGEKLEEVKSAIEKITTAEQTISSNILHPTRAKLATAPSEIGERPGESYVPTSNVQSESAGFTVGPRDTGDEGEEPTQAYQGEGEMKASGGDPNRLNPITPATGSRQTSATANSLISIKKLKAAAERTTRELGPEAVHGNARERANMGKGALDTYEFQGPYDYPVYPGGRPDDTLTMMGAWRTDGGNDSSLWYSKKTAKGANAKRNKYFKWSTKNGGKWRKMSKDEMVNVIQKGGVNENRFYGTRTNLKFAEFQARRDRSVAMAQIGNRLTVNANHGYGSHGRDKYKDANIATVASSADAPEPKQIGEIKQESKQGANTTPVGVTTPEPKLREVYPASGIIFDDFVNWNLRNHPEFLSSKQHAAEYQRFMQGKNAGKWKNYQEWYERIRAEDNPPEDTEVEQAPRGGELDLTVQEWTEEYKKALAAREAEATKRKRIEELGLLGLLGWF